MFQLKLPVSLLLNEGLEAPQYMNEAYMKRRDYLKDKLESLGFDLTAQPEGAFYIFPSIKIHRQ